MTLSLPDVSEFAAMLGLAESGRNSRKPLRYHGPTPSGSHELRLWMVLIGQDNEQRITIALSLRIVENIGETECQKQFSDSMANRGALSFADRIPMWCK